MTSPATKRRATAKRKAAPSRRAAVGRGRLAAALAAQAASAEILRAIATSPSDSVAVFDAIARNAVRLCGAVFCNVLRYDGEMLHMMAHNGFSAASLERLRAIYPTRPQPNQISGRVIARKAAVRIRDVQADKQYDQQAAKPGEWRRMFGVPMLRHGKPLGVIAVGWKDPGDTPASQIELLQTFADQAVIALDNARLFNDVETRNRELGESLERQTATSDILRAISRSPTDLQPVFDIIAQSAVKLCGAEVATVTRVDAELVHLAAVFGSGPASVEALRRAFPMPPGADSGAARAIRDRAIVCIPDVLSDRRYRIQETAVAAGFRAILSVPMLRDGRAIGAITVGRVAPGDFSDTQVQLLTTFADQALIAVENVRLFNDTKEALEQQTAIGDILRATSTALADLSDVFEAVLSNAIHLCEGDVAVLWRYDGTHLRLAAHKNASPGGAAYLAQHPLELGAYNPTPRAGLERRVIHELDVFANPGYRPLVPRGQPGTNTSSTQIAVPLVREDRLLGVITIWRFEKRPFSDKQVALLGTFADQAVIAIENVRLFNETKEALERQTATAEILKVIASSPSDVQPVFDAIARSALHLMGGRTAVVVRRAGDYLQLAAHTATTETGDEAMKKSFPMRFTGHGFAGRAVLSGLPAMVSDIETDTFYSSEFREMARARGVRSVLSVPMLREGEGIGAINVWRSHPGCFTEHQVELLKTFAAQAVIAIENVRLFNETKEALERQTATGEILSSISSSMADTQPVFDAIITNLLRLFNTKFVVVQLVREDGQIDVAAQFGHGDVERLTGGYPRPVDDSTLGGRVVMSGRTVQYAPVADNPRAPSTTREWSRRFGFDSVIATPLKRQDKVVGVIVTAHEDATPFDDKQVALIKSFADQAVIAIENARLFNETKEALERQTAISEVLRVISSSPTDLRPVMEAVVESAARLANSDHALIGRAEDGRVRWLAAHGCATPEGTPPITRALPSGRAMLDLQTTQIGDVAEVAEDFPTVDRAYRELGVRTIVATPLTREGQAIGVLLLRRTRVQPFTEKEVALLKTFADQAAIAIENVRLFNETKASLERQTATAEILGVISRSPTDVQPVFEVIASSALRLCDGAFSTVTRFDGKDIHFAAFSNVLPDFEDAVRGAWPQQPGPTSATSRAVEARSMVQVPDILEDSTYGLRDVAEKAGFRSVLAMPMLREGTPVGAITVSRVQPGVFPADQVALLRTFADQAVIAIENARLFNETKEALEHQKASAEILRVISGSPTDVQPVFDAIVQSCFSLFKVGRVTLWLRAGEEAEVRAHMSAAAETAWASTRMPVDRESALGRCLLDCRMMHLPDLLQVSDELPRTTELGLLRDYRAMLIAPLVREGRAIGVLSLLRREPGAFDEKEIVLLQAFADQAVIAIENVRLFNETKEALERQTATSEVLRVISNSPTDVQPVFDAIAQSARRLFSGFWAHVVLAREGRIVAAAVAAEPEVVQAVSATFPIPLDDRSLGGQVILKAELLSVADATAPDLPQFVREMSRKAGVRSLMAAPMVRDKGAIGAIIITRTAPGDFDAKQRSLLQTFADQAVIAIDNVRLFNETKEALEQQTAIGEVLRVISSYPNDVEPTLQAVAERATRLCDASAATIYVLEGALLRRTAFHGSAELLGGETLEYSAETLTGRTIEEGTPIHVRDIEEERARYPRSWELAQRYGRHSMLSVPLMREGKPFGTMFLRRAEVRPFNDKQISLATTFADQAAIAIENVRLFQEIQEKSRQLEEASKHKSQFLASMSHELRTPLNAILGFNEMLLGGIYGDVPGDMMEPMKDIQTSGKHLLRLINNVLDLAKIEAGRMELALAEYSVHDTVAGVQATLRPLAAEKGLEFVARVQEDIPLAHGDAGRLTQCLVNLAGNSLKFTKAGKVEIAVTQDNGLLRYSVMDTGIGIPSEKIASLFTEFKQTDATIASEYGGTGLGLSITKKFIEMHGGRIWVESELGKGSSFIFEIPVRARA